MRSSSSVGLGLSLVFGCLLLALMAELYYLLWWKKRYTNTEISQETYSSPGSEFLYLFCWKKPSSLSSTGLTTDTQVHEPQPSSSSSWFRPFGQGYDDQMNVETELLRLQNLSGPPRFLFTIKEETKEELESEERSKKGSRGRSLSDVMHQVETPFYTPLASPHYGEYLTPPITPGDSIYKPFSPLSHSSSDAEFNRIWASPPPMFKFLRDAEDKLQKRKQIERLVVADDSVQKKDHENGSFITLLVAKEKDHNSSSSQVLPLAASPPTSRPQFRFNPNSF